MLFKKASTTGQRQKISGPRVIVLLSKAVVQHKLDIGSNDIELALSCVMMN